MYAEKLRNLSIYIDRIATAVVQRDEDRRARNMTQAEKLAYQPGFGSALTADDIELDGEMAFEVNVVTKELECIEFELRVGLLKSLVQLRCWGDLCLSLFKLSCGKVRK